MKKILIVLAMLVTLGVADASAQSANRKGFYIDYTLGYSCAGYYDDYDEESYLEQGVDLGIGFGYRLKMSTHWAWDFRINTLFTIPDIWIGRCFSASPIGIRWTSNDNSKGKSFVWGMHIGTGFPQVIHGETYFGMNLTRKLALELLAGVGGNIDYYYGVTPSFGVRLTQRF